MERALKSLVLIRAKHLAESVTTPTFLADTDGNLIFYNEAAEALLGRRFSDTGAMSATKWQEVFDVRNRDGSPFPLEAMPGWMEVQKHRPATGHLQFRTADGEDRVIAVCAIPLFSGPERFEGAAIIFWEDEES
jgi:PAS domain-containing protein